MMQQSDVILCALSEPTRLWAMHFLRDGKEHCVCEIMQSLKITQSRASRHMSVLKAAGLVVDRRDAQWVRYRRNPVLTKKVVALLNAALALEKTPKTRVLWKCPSTKRKTS